MSDPLREAGPLVTEHQLPAVLVERDLFLTACPGSGKTRTAAVRVARLADDGLRVAACSYTNTGVEELRQSLAQDVGLTLGPQHFSGTLHQFLLRFVLHPFGQLVLGCSASPRIITPEAWPDVVFDSPNVRLALHHFQFRPDGSLCVRNKPARFKYSPEQAVALRGTQALRTKRDLARHRGWVSTDDAMYWALEVLRRHPRVGAALTSRFDEILVDEAQDTSELQLACLDALHACGTLRSLALIGDLDQSIYSYNGAHPTGCAALVDVRGLKHVELRENRRSSQGICDSLAHLHSRGRPDVATGPDRNCSWPPELVLYPAKDPAAAVPPFLARLRAVGEDLNQAAVLARTNDLVDAINGALPLDKSKMNVNALRIARLVHAQRGGATLGRRDLDHLDRQLALMAWDRNDLTGVAPDVRWGLRRASMALLATAPELDTDLHTWTVALRSPLRDAVALLTDQPARRIGQWLRATKAMRDYLVAELASASIPIPQARTVHDIKGATRASLLYIVDKASSRRTPPATLLGGALTGAPTAPDDAEEIRIAYVALTRARRLCRIALPDDTPSTIIEQFSSQGFVWMH